MFEITSPFGPPGFLTLAGSRLFGINTDESDYDYIGAVVESSDYLIGLSNWGQQHGFEQEEFKGDNYEGSIYSLRKFVRMLAEGNPTILCTMFSTIAYDEYGITSADFRRRVLTKKSGYRFLRYMASQRKDMTTQRSKHVTRLDLIERYGFDTKFAGHVLRLGFQGVEFLATKHITLPMRPEEAEIVLAVRRGEWTEENVIRAGEELEARIEALIEVSDLPEQPDYNYLHRWLVQAYRRTWCI